MQRYTPKEWVFGNLRELRKEIDKLTPENVAQMKPILARKTYYAQSWENEIPDNKFLTWVMDMGFKIKRRLGTLTHIVGDPDGE